MTDDTTRVEVTEELLEMLVKRELLDTSSPLKITPGMRRAVQERRLRHLLEHAQQQAELWPASEFDVEFVESTDDISAAPDIWRDSRSIELRQHLQHRDPAWMRPWLAVILPALLGVALIGTFVLVALEQLPSFAALTALFSVEVAVLIIGSDIYSAGRRLHRQRQRRSSD